MPRSLEDIIKHADELADMFERLEPADLKEIPVAEYLLQRAVTSRAHAERGLVDAVIRARHDGLSWAAIGQVLGTSPQAAQQRYGRLVAKAPQRERPGA